MMGSYIEICRPSAVATSCFHDHSVINVVQLEVHFAKSAARRHSVRTRILRLRSQLFAKTTRYNSQYWHQHRSNNKVFGRSPLLTNARSSKWSVSVSQSPRTL